MWPWWLPFGVNLRQQGEIGLVIGTGGGTESLLAGASSGIGPGSMVYVLIFGTGAGACGLS